MFDILHCGGEVGVAFDWLLVCWGPYRDNSGVLISVTLWVWESNT